MSDTRSSHPAPARPGRLRRWRRGAAALAVTAGATGLLAASTGTASASSAFTTHLTPNNTFFLQLDVAGASTAPGAPVIDWYANGGANQTWTFTPDGVDSYEIVNQNSGQCLTTDGVAGHQLVQLPCNGGLGQLWRTALTPQQALTTHTISNPWSGLNVDVSGNSPWPGTAIDAWYPNGGANQAFAAD